MCVTTRGTKERGSGGRGRCFHSFAGRLRGEGSKPVTWGSVSGTWSELVSGCPREAESTEPCPNIERGYSEDSELTVPRGV